MVLFDFSGIYEHQDFWKTAPCQMVDLRELSGCNCYCDQEAAGILSAEIGKYSVRGIHFLDSGNYHYMTRLWLERIREPFGLLVLDHHTDMQLPAFGGLLSCGGWIASALEELPLLQKVWLAGPLEEDFSQVQPEFFPRVEELSQEQLSQKFFSFLEEIPRDFPLYVSIDKDVLSPREVPVNWSQGILSLQEMLEGLEILWKKQEGNLLGVDICGECEKNAAAWCVKENNRVNQVLADFWQERGGWMQ